VRGFQEKPTRDEARSDLANCGVYVIEPELLERIPADTFVDFGNDIWPSLVAANEEIYAYTTMAYWNDVGDLDELRNTILDAVLGHVRIDIPGKEVARGAGRRRAVESTTRLSSTARSSSAQRRHREGRAGARSGRDRRGVHRRQGCGHPQRRALSGTAVPDEGLAIAGIFGDASKLATRCFGIPRAASSCELTARRLSPSTHRPRSARHARVGDCYPTPQGWYGLLLWVRLRSPRAAPARPRLPASLRRVRQREDLVCP
jgi:hypothetical protein